MSAAIDKLILGIPIPHATNGATTFTNTATAFSATSAAGASLPTTDPGVRFAAVSNFDAAKYLYVNVGNTVTAPAAAQAGSFPVAPGATAFFQSGLSCASGAQMVLNVITSASTLSGSIQWFR